MIKNILQFFFLNLIVFSFSLFTFISIPLTPCILYAQQPSITSDGTLNTIIDKKRANYEISGGKMVGPNQFHSFSSFNILEGESASFKGPATIQNIVGRVTGCSSSFINGPLRCDIDGANLYLLNPHGILFGFNAQLDLRGAFHASTADYLRLGENGFFFAAISENSILSMNSPSAFGFLEENPKSIEIDGSRLRVREHHTLSVVGGDINVRGGGRLDAPGGKLNIASAASSGEFVMENDGLMADDMGKFGSITLTDATQIDASGEGGGTVSIRGGKLVIDKTCIKAVTRGSVDGIGIAIDMAESVVMNNGSVSTETIGRGNAGNIKVRTGNLYLEGGSGINSDSDNGASGNGGNIFVRTSESLTMREKSAIGASTLTKSTGNAGDIAIQTPKFDISGRSYIDNSSYGTGQGGDVDIEAEDSITITDGWLISQTAVSGPAGHIHISANGLTMTEAAEITSECSGNGDAGIITVKSSHLNIKSKSAIKSESNGSGNGGDIFIKDAMNVCIEDAWVTAKSFEDGDAGNIHISSAEHIRLDNGHILTKADKSDGGNITLTNGYMTALFESEISASVGGGPETEGGNISIDPRFVILDDSKILAQASLGRGGRIDIITDVFLADSNSRVDASSDEGGIDGSVDIRAAYKYLSKNPAPMAEDFRNAVDLLKEPCLARIHRGRYNSLYVSGREALAIEPGGLMPSPVFER